jgi:hypothetical protein
MALQATASGPGLHGTENGACRFDINDENGTKKLMTDNR